MDAVTGRPREGGFTLLEVCVAMGVLAAAGMILTTSLSAAVRASAVVRERAAALSAAEDRLERAIALCDGTAAGLAASDGARFAVEGLAAIEGDPSVGIVTVDPTELPLVGIAVRVRWRGVDGRDEITLRTTVLATDAAP